MEQETQVVKFDVTEAAIVALGEKYADPKVPQGKDEYDALKAGIKEVRDLRVAVDKERKAQTAAALEHQRAVNSIGHGIINRLKDIEEPMKAAKAEVDEAEERRVREAEEAEDNRLQGINTRLARIVEYGTVSINDTVEDCKQRLARVEELDPTQGFDEFAKTAAEYQAKALENLKSGLEKLEQQAELDKKAKELEEREAKLNADQAARDAEDRKKKEAEQQEEQDRLRRLEAEQKDRERKAEAEAEEARRLELAPDREKIMAFAEALSMVPLPKVDTVAGSAAVAAIDDDLCTLISDIKSTADRL